MSDHLADQLLLLQAVSDTQRRLLSLRSRADARAALVGFAERLGAELVPAHPPAADALPIDVSAGSGDPLVPVAAPGTPLRDRLERHLPELVQQAQQAASLLEGVGVRRDRRQVDPLTGAPGRDVLRRAVERAVPGEDRLVGLVVGQGGWLIEPFGRMRVDGLLGELADLLRELRHPADPWGRLGGHGLAVLLLRSDAAASEAFLREAERRWPEARGLAVDLRCLALPVTDPPATSLERLEVALGLEGTQP